MTGLTQYRKAVVAVLSFISVLAIQLQQLGGPNVKVWTLVATGIGAFLVYLTPNGPPAP